MQFKIFVLLLIIQVIFSNPTKLNNDFVNAETIHNLYRLKNSFKTIEYGIQMNISKEVLEDPMENIISNTVTSILFEWVDKTDRKLQFHDDINYLKISSILLANNSEVPFNQKTDCNKETQICTINLPEKIPDLENNQFKLVFKSDSLLSTEMLGMYKSSYQNHNGEKEYFIATQFEPTYARRVFPCLDEPSFKAKFKLDITVPQSSGYVVLTNAKNKNRTFYEELPRMSTYLVAFVISKFTSTHQIISQDQTSHKVWSKPGLEEYRNFSWKIAPEIMDEFGLYLNKNYSSLGINKSDEVAIPSFGAAMENWGLITFSEDMLLYNEKENSALAKINTIKAMVHEMAHLWFGNWVTLEWWDVAFLNEGFAKYFEYFTTNDLYSEFEMDQQFVVDVLQRGLEIDENQFASALMSTCNSVSEINMKLMDGISHFKGASIIKMIRDIMGEEQFQKGLQDYVETNRNVRPSDLLVDLNKYTEKDVYFIMLDWIKLSGFPLIKVKLLNKGIIELSQTNFRTNKESSWIIPVHVKTDIDESNHLLQETIIISIKQAEWVLLKNTLGFYRVNYDDQLWSALTKALAKNKTDIDDLSKSQIVDDLFALGRTKNLPYSKIFDYMEFLNTTDNYYVWVPAFKGFDFLLKRFKEEAKIKAQIIRLIKERMPDFDLHEDESELDVIKKSLIFEWQCRTGNENAIKLAQEKFSSFLDDEQPKNDIDLREVVYCYGQKDEDDWQKLKEKYNSTSDSFARQIILKSLACGNEKQQKSLLELTTNEEMQRQEKVAVFLSVLQRNVDVALDFYIKYAIEIEKTYPPLTLPLVISSLGDALTSQSQIKKLSNIENILSETSKKLLSASLILAEKNLGWTEEVKKELVEYFGISGSPLINFNIYLIASVIFVICFF